MKLRKVFEFFNENFNKIFWIIKEYELLRGSAESPKSAKFSKMYAKNDRKI